MKLSTLSILTILYSSARGLQDLSSLDCRAAPANTTFISSNKLPNPFKFLDGSFVTTKAQWACRREEIRNLVLDIEYGPYPSTLPRSNITASYTPFLSNDTSIKNGTITITVTSPSQTISFPAKISFPAEAAAKKPYPVIIVWGGATIPLPSYAAVLYYNNDQIASAGSEPGRGQGKFYNAYPSLRSTTGVFAGIARGLSRIIDALEILSDDMAIDTSKIAITGCSRNAKSVLLAGAMDERVALTIPQEGGEAADNCWRIREAVKQVGGRFPSCDYIECPTDYTPYSPKFPPYTTSPNTLPFDQHMLAALIAPRGLFVLQNDIDWLMPVAGLGCMNATRLVYEALGAKSEIGWSMDGAHNHCQFHKDKQGVELVAFYERFLQGGPPIDIWKSIPEKGDVGNWIDWSLPMLG